MQYMIPGKGSLNRLANHITGLKGVCYLVRQLLQDNAFYSEKAVGPGDCAEPFLLLADSADYR